MRFNNNEREIVIRHIVGSLLPIVLKRDIEQITKVCSMNAISLYLETIIIKIEEEQRITRQQMQNRKIKILELITKEGIHCRYTSNGYEQQIDMLPTIIKIACDHHLQDLMGLPRE
ncbi:hypothetical protein AB4Z50_14615 [Paenibacillus sp. 2TAB26]|uniref:hypothetical protein n=1 Tax=Paenibacillus sp. 2TAB26 TaxID=3233005 RepID=UPI003F986FC6